MEFRLLGPVECDVAGEPVALGRPQERCLLAVLLMELGAVVSVDRLVELLWDGDPPGRARSIVHTHVSRVRATLRRAGAERHGVHLVTRGQGYALQAPAEAVDVHRFRRLVDQAHAPQHPAASADLLTRALALWRGPALADTANARVREQFCAGLEELRLATLEDRFQAELALGRERTVATELTGLVARHPRRERAVGLLMLALYRSGQQARALEIYRRTRQALIEELGIEPSADLRRLEHAILIQDRGLELADDAVARRAGSRASAPQNGNGEAGVAHAVLAPARPVGAATAPYRSPAGIPGAGYPRPPAWRGQRSHLTNIIGRDQQLAELGRLLSDHRLVTIVGVGGVGKTTLALHAAEVVVKNRPVVVGALDLARDEDDIVLALGGILGVGGTSMADVWDGVERHVAEAAPLLVLDSCEHVAAACASVVRRLLSASAGVVVLATSRQRLSLPEETVWRLDPLGVPTDPENGADSPAMALLLRRAGDARPGFAPSAADLAAAARICGRVDGLPLALELAAARLGTTSMTRLADQLEEDLELLRSVRRFDRRQHTLTATIEWSYRLLRPDEQRLLGRLSVFRGGFTIDLAAQVCGADPLAPGRVPALVASLADRSLVQPYESPTGPRYRLLEVVREYASARLDRAGESVETARRHRDHWLGRGRDLLALPQVDEQLVGWARMSDDLDNLHAAAESALAAGPPDAALELCVLVSECLAANNADAENERWLDRVWPDLAHGPPGLRSAAQFQRATLQTVRGDPLGSLLLIRPILDDLAAHNPLHHQDAQLTRIRNEAHLLDPVALRDAPAAHARLRSSPDRHTRMHSLVMAAEVLVTWGRYGQAREVCTRDEPSPEDLDRGGGLRYDAVRCLAELGAGQVEASASIAERLRGRLTRPGYLNLNRPVRALALWTLATQPPAMAGRIIGDLMAMLSHRYPPAMCRGYALELLLAEALRRTGDLATALPHLRAGLALSRERTDYSTVLSGVITAALLAVNLGEERAGQEIAGGWQRLRTTLGLPAPLGFEEQVGQLGLDPAAPAGPAGRWRHEPLRQLIAGSHDWCVRAAGSG